MTTMTVLVIASLLCIGLMYYGVRGQVAPYKTLQELEGHTMPIDLLAFQNLIDPKDQQFLRERLPALSYRKVQRKRISTCIRYVRSCAQNAAVLMRVGEAVSENTNPEIRASGQHIVGEALRMRIFAIAVIPKLYFWLLFPDSQLSFANVCKKYSQMAAAVDALSRLQESAFAPRIFSAL